MTDNNNRIDQLLEKLEALVQKQDSFSKEIDELRLEINNLRKLEEAPSVDEKVPGVVAEEEDTPEPLLAEIRERHRVTETPPPTATEPVVPPTVIAPSWLKERSNLEKFIGENLINKIGIAITIIGVAVGAKYSIDHQLISPLTRIILGYLVGAGLLGFGIRLKQKYENYSAVLVSGAITIMYFITYLAYDLYGLLPQTVAFVLMVLFTIFTVVAAVNYNRQLIAHIGLVGAYAVPFLLSDGSGRVGILFTYMAIINTGILIISFKRYWKALSYSSFILTWLIYSAWHLFGSDANDHISLAMTFLFVFFATFYASFLAYKLLHNEQFAIADIVLVLINSFLFYGLGYDILNGHETGKQLLGVFTLCNAIIHFIISMVIYKRKLADKSVFYFISGLVLVFLTITIPVQLDGNWVTLLWIFEAALLFWIGRTKNVPVYETLSYPLMALAFFSLVQNWSVSYNNYHPEVVAQWLTPIFNLNFLTSALFVAALSLITYLQRSKKHVTSIGGFKDMLSIVNYAIPAALLIVLYFSFFLEISNYWHQIYFDTAVKINGNSITSGETYFDNDLNKYSIVWLINYTLLFFTLLSFVNIKRIKNMALGYVCIGLGTLVILVFLTQGLYQMSELRESYLQQTLSEYFHRGAFNISIRYVSYVFAAGMLLGMQRHLSQDFMQPITRPLYIAFEMLVYTTIVWVASSELLSWMDIAGSSQSYKLGLSILWGVYALMMIAIGIWKKKKHLRIGAIGLFAITLLKLFFYDISHMETIAKTIVLVSLGILLLIISFLYNKYKHIITDEQTD